MTTNRSPFSLLTHLAGDAEQLDIFSDEAAIESWLAVERALAQAQGELGVIDADDAAQIVAAARRGNVSEERLWESTRNVGYPILAIVREISAALPEGPNGRVHYGATTQDIMDSGLALQLERSLASLDRRLEQFGDALAERSLSTPGPSCPAGPTRSRLCPRRSAPRFPPCWASSPGSASGWPRPLRALA